MHQTKERPERGIVWVALNVPVIYDPPLTTPNMMLGKGSHWYVSITNTGRGEDSTSLFHCLCALTSQPAV